jgi:hypothetical protein
VGSRGGPSPPPADDPSERHSALPRTPRAGAGGESFLRVHWVAVPEALRARRLNRRQWEDATRGGCW